MPWNGSGVFTRLYSWVADKNAGIDIVSSRVDADTNDIVTGLENTVTLDGQTTPIHSLPMGGFNHTGVGNATARTSYAAAGQVQDGALVWGGTSGGTANAQTISLTPTLTALAPGQKFSFLVGAGLTNTGATTLAINAIAATAVRKPGGAGPVALSGNELVAGNLATVEYDGTYLILVNVVSASSVVIRSYLAGLTLSTAGGSGTFGIAAGVSADSTGAAMMALASAYTKTTASWSVGTGNGSLDTGAIAPSTWYHVHEIMRTDTGVVDVLVSLSATSPTLPASYTLFRRIGSMKTDGSSHWLAFTQRGDDFDWTTPINDINVSNLASGSITTFVVTVPTGVNVKAKIRGFTNLSTAATGIVIVPLSETGTTQAGAITGNYNVLSETATTSGGFEMDVWTNTLAQIGAGANAANTDLAEVTHGWIDRRGRDA